MDEILESNNLLETVTFSSIIKKIAISTHNRIITPDNTTCYRSIVSL